MALSENKIKEYIKRLLLSRMRILCNHGFYGLLLMHMVYAVSEELETACTDGVRITFGTDFLDSLSDSELDFVMMHEILHVVLQHCIRGEVEDQEAFNIAADIVVNSNILLENGMKLSSINLSKYGTMMHTAPDGKEGYEYTAEQVYSMLPKNANKKGKDKSKSIGSSDGRAKKELAKEWHKPISVWDDHSQWGKYEEDDTLREVWVKRFEDAAKAIEIRDPSKSFGGLPVFAQRLLKEIKNGQIDWREILNNFIQEEILDYSFAPPDRRFDECPFFLPDFNEKEETIGNIWFVIDTSGSISDSAINAAYSEICSALNQFNGKLSGLLSFTESYVTEPIPFSSVNELMEIKPVGGGGNDFSDIFRYMNNNMSDNLPAQIIIITDGYDTFPNEEVAMGIPVLWLINNEDVNPPWGKIARIKI